MEVSGEVNIILLSNANRTGDWRGGGGGEGEAESVQMEFGGLSWRARSAKKI